MNRLSLRVQKPVHAVMIAPDGQEQDVALRDLGLGGVCIDPVNVELEDSLKKNAFHSIKLRLDKIGKVFLSARVVRNENECVGLRFLTIPQGDLIKIWQFIRDEIDNSKTCPYCNTRFDGHQGQCPFCSWKLNFKDKDYLIYWERESLMRSIQASLKELSANDLRKLVRQLNGQLPVIPTSAEVEEIEEFVGTCTEMMKVFRMIPRVGPTDLPVLILGESGTGKELTARAIHERSDRKQGPFVPINCAAIPEHLLESELFGHHKGAFTGAYKQKKGKFEYADQGTLFLDEIGEIPLDLQPKLLRFLETQQIERVGGYQKKRLDVRILAATNRKLERDVGTGQFRADLYYRIKVFTINLPPLRDRGEDKVILAKYFLKRIKTAETWDCQGFSDKALDAIRKHTWPGNVRELINRIRRALVMQNQWIQPSDLELETVPAVRCRKQLKAAKDQLKKELIEKTLEENSYNITRSAKRLGISRQHLYVLKKKLNIVTP